MISKARIVVLIAMVNLVVAVSSLTIQDLTKLNACECLPMAVFSLTTFPVLTFLGNPILASGSMWAITAFLLLLLLNAVIWGIAGAFGARTYRWLYRLFWFESDGGILNEESNLKWDVLFVVFTHAILLAILFGLLVFLVPLPFALLGDFGGSLPLPVQLLWKTSIVWRHPLVDILLVFVFLFIDGRNYLWLCRTRGKKAATIWAISVTVVIVMAIVWYATLALIFSNTVIRWKLR